MSWQGVQADERGFTLIEVMVVVMIMGIVLGIATSSWFGVVENRQVDSATKQVVADLRLVHSQATNRLVDSSFIVPSANSTTYQVGPAGSLVTRTLPGDDQGTPNTKIVVAATTTIAFKASGGAVITPAGNIEVAALDGSPCHVIKVNSVTSRVELSTDAC